MPVRLLAGAGKQRNDARAPPRAQLRSRRNFCTDIVLIILLLAIVVYIINIVQVRGKMAMAERCSDARTHSTLLPPPPIPQKKMSS